MNPFDDSSPPEEQGESKKEEENKNVKKQVKGVTFVPPPPPPPPSSSSSSSFSLNPFKNSNEEEKEKKKNIVASDDDKTPVSSNQKTYNTATSIETSSSSSEAAAVAAIISDTSTLLLEEEFNYDQTRQSPPPAAAQVEPWQFQWKRPQLHLPPSPPTPTTTTHSPSPPKHPINAASARLSPTEQSFLSQYISNITGIPCPDPSVVVSKNGKKKKGGGGSGAILYSGSQDAASHESSLRLWENMLEEEEEDEDEDSIDLEEIEEEKEKEEEEDLESQQDWVLSVTVLSSSQNYDSGDDHDDEDNDKKLEIGDALLVEISAADSVAATTNTISNSFNSNSLTEEKEEEEEEDDVESEAGVDNNAAIETNGGEGVNVVFSRTLQWPSSALIETMSPPPPPPQQQQHYEEEKTEESREKTGGKQKWNLLANLFHASSKNFSQKGEEEYQRKRQKLQKRNLKNEVGIVSISLCRRRFKHTEQQNLNDGGEGEGEYNEENAAEALDTIRFLTFGMGLSNLERGDDLDEDEENLYDEKEDTEDKKEVDKEKEGTMTIVTDHPASSSSAAAAKKKKSKEKEEKQHQEHEGKSSELLLCCLTNDGQVHVFPILDVLQDNAAARLSEQDSTSPALQKQQEHHQHHHGHHQKKHKEEGNNVEDDDVFFNGLATLLLGRDLHDRVMDTMVPLSHPRATVPLSIFSSKSFKSGDDDKKKKKERLAEIKEEESSDQAEKEEGKKEAAVEDDHPQQMEPNITATISRSSFDLSAFDATIEPSTIHYKTIKNIPTICSPSFEYVAIGGWGLRRMKRRVLRNKMMRKEKSWHGETASDYNTASPHHQQYTKWVWEEYNEIGGFVTFISLKHYSETRTIYLPFAPKQMSPIIWEKMQFLVILGENQHGDDDAASSVTNPMAVAVRVDSFVLSEPTTLLSKMEPELEDELMEVSKNEGLPKTPAATADSTLAATSAFVSHDEPSGASIRSLRLEEETFSLRTQQEEKQTSKRQRQRKCNVRRFKPLPILLPAEERKILSETTEKVLASVVSVTSMLTSPPAIGISYTTATTNSANKKTTSFPGTTKIDDVYLALHTMCGFEYVPANSIAMAFGGVRPGALRRGASVGGNRLMAPTDGGGSVLIVRTKVQPGHMARIPAADAFRESRSEQLQKKVPSHNHPEVWCLGGQGWSIVGFGNMNIPGVYFISWEGAVVSHGAHVTELLNHSSISPNGIGKLRVNPSTVATILPIGTSIERRNSRKQPEIGQEGSEQEQSSFVALPFTSPYHMPSFLKSSDGRSVGNTYDTYKSSMFIDDTSLPDFDKSVDGIVIDALDSITNLSYHDDKKASLLPSEDRRRGWLELSHAEKSKRLLRRCSSWTQLDDTEENRALIDGRVIVATMRLGGRSCDNLSLTLRQNVVTNGVATPFHEVLAWLCQRKDYFTAASVALSLLNDFDALRDLRGSHSIGGNGQEKSDLEGLLDGVIPLKDSDYIEQPSTDDSSLNADKQSIISNFSATQERKKPLHCPITSLADMAVGCLVKGGTNMSKTLEGFLGRNIYYDESRASLMLVATISSAISDHHDLKSRDISKADDTEDDNSALKEFYEDIFWPIRCLLQVAVKRDCMVTALLLLNATIPNEMRRKKQRNFLGKKKSFHRPSLFLCKSIITMIAESSSSAAGLLLSLADEFGKNRYWQSLDHDTRLAFALISVRGKYPLLREAEVRAWAVEQLVLCIKTSSEDGFEDGLETTSTLPSHWLKGLCSACLSNAESNVQNLYARTSPFSSQDNLSVTGTVDMDLPTDSSGADQHGDVRNRIKNALLPSPGSGGIDFDLMIPALLLLQRRSVKWNEDSIFSSQLILNELCDLAGRYSPEESAFAFDGATVMKLCAISENVQAAANLIGGRDGFVLKCADVLMTCADMTMDKAERYLLTGEVNAGPPRQINYPESLNESSFQITSGHQQLLSLIEEHVLNVKTYGEFQTVHIRGRVDPVFAARVCLRAWLCLMRHGSPGSGSWLVAWLREKLGIRSDENNKSKKRLPCAALCRALLWPDDSDGMDEGNRKNTSLLAESLGFEPKFWVELAQSCCGLIESVPPTLANRIMNDALDMGGKGLTTNVLFAVK